MKAVVVKHVTHLFMLITLAVCVCSCGTTRKVGQEDADRINRNEQQFNRDMETVF